MAVLDPRIRAAVAHEPDLGPAHSNWSDPWYLGSPVRADRDQDDLLRLVAPCPFLLAGGGASDGRHNDDLVGRARPGWGERRGLETLCHDNGHAPPDHVLVACYTWLAARLDGPEPLPLEMNPLMTDLKVFVAIRPDDFDKL